MTIKRDAINRRQVLAAGALTAVAGIQPAVAADVTIRQGYQTNIWGMPTYYLMKSGLLEKRESLYNNIFIFGDRDQVTMTFGQNKRYYTESSMKLSDPGALTVDYTRLMTLGVAYQEKVERIAEIGLGGGRTVSYLSQTLPDAGILAIELDKDVVDLATVIARAKGLDAVHAEAAGRIFLGIFFAETSGRQNAGNARSNEYIGSMQTGVSEDRDGPSRGRLATQAASTYKLPSFSEMPEVFNVTLLEKAHEDGAVYGSKAVGEPPLMLAFSVREALREAVAAFGPTGHCVDLGCPSTPEQLFWAIQRARSTDAPTRPKEAPAVQLAGGGA